MECQCGHTIHRSELYSKLYRNTTTKAFIIKWRCMMCGHDGQFECDDIDIPEVLGNNVAVIRGIIIAKHFLSDIDNAEELKRFIDMGPVTGDECLVVHQTLESDKNVLSDLQRIGKR